MQTKIAPLAKMFCLSHVKAKNKKLDNFVPHMWHILKRKEKKNVDATFLPIFYDYQFYQKHVIT